MVYVILYNTKERSCQIGDRATLVDFAKYMTGKEKYPVAVLRIRRKFKQVELPFNVMENENA